MVGEDQDYEDGSRNLNGVWESGRSYQAIWTMLQRAKRMVWPFRKQVSSKSRTSSMTPRKLRWPPPMSSSQSRYGPMVVMRTQSSTRFSIRDAFRVVG